MTFLTFVGQFCISDEIEVACLKNIKKDDLVKFFKVKRTSYVLGFSFHPYTVKPVKSDMQCVTNFVSEKTGCRFKQWKV